MEHNSQGVAASQRRNPCPPHGPHLVDAARLGSYVAKCLACGLAGPVRKDVLEAKLAFEETWR